jgi:hypothetical protein
MQRLRILKRWLAASGGGAACGEDGWRRCGVRVWRAMLGREGQRPVMPAPYGAPLFRRIEISLIMHRK